jgi:hypothetical protein
VGTAELADQLRHLVADAELKMEEELDRQYILEDLLGRLGSMADDMDGRVSLASTISAEFPAYPLTPREDLGTLTVEV